MMTTNDTTDGLRTPNKAISSPPKIDSYTGALALIDILFDMKVINKATYDNIKRNANNNYNKKGLLS